MEPGSCEAYGKKERESDMGMLAKVYGVGTPGLYLDQGPSRLWPKIRAEGLCIRIRKALCNRLRR
jgi:hypothetical protein